MRNRDEEDRSRGSDLDLRRGYQQRNQERGEPREDPFDGGFDRPEPGEPLEQVHEPRYTQPYDRWRPRDYVFYSGAGYSREFIEPYKLPGEGRRYAGRGPRNYVRSDERILEDVNERLTEHPDIEATNIAVRVEGGEVTLEGWVPDRLMKRLAEDVAYATRGVVDVHNRIRMDQRVREIPILPGHRNRRQAGAGESRILSGERSPEHETSARVEDADALRKKTL